MLPTRVIEVLLYLREDGRSPFVDWFDRLDTQAAAKVTVAVERLKLGNVANVKSVGEGVQELRMHWGPGHRVYFGRDGERLVILLTGGTKRRQDDDIAKAKVCWADYKRRR